MYWQQAGTANAPGGSNWWFAQATTSGQGKKAVATFSDGTFDVSADAYSGRHAATGEFGPGTDGTFVIHVPRADVGSPADGATLTNTFADTAGAFLVAGTGLRFIARADRAPDSNYGADHGVAQTCTADLSVSQTAGPDPVHIGQALTFTIKVTNGGPDAAKGVTLSDQFGRNAGFGSVSTDHGSCTAKPDKRLVTCGLGTLGAGEAATVTLVVKPNRKGSFTNTATAGLASPADPNSSNDTSSKTVTVLP